MQQHIVKIAIIATGGGAGALLCYFISGWAQRFTFGTFPMGTLTVNVIGCLAIGFLGALFAGPFLIREEYRLAALVGVLGSFTTFSTYSLDTFNLIESRQSWLAILNVLLSNALGLLGVWIGYRLAERWLGI